jgi:hypothetical protein
MFVQFSDQSQQEVIAIFGCPQNEEAWPNQGEVADDDPRLLSFIEIHREKLTQE